jgi:hypothetical protein
MEHLKHWKFICAEVWDFEVATVKNTALWDVMPWSLVEIYLVLGEHTASIFSEE